MGCPQRCIWTARPQRSGSGEGLFGPQCLGSASDRHQSKSWLRGARSPQLRPAGRSRPHRPSAQRPILHRATRYCGRATYRAQPRTSRASADKNAFAAAGVPLEIRNEVQLATAICAFVRAGAGLGLVNPIAAHEWRSRQLVPVPFQPGIPFFNNRLFPASRARQGLRLLA